MCQGAKDTVFFWGGYDGCPSGGTYLYGWVFLYTEAGNVLSDPGETKVSKKGVSPSLLGAMW